MKGMINYETSILLVNSFKKERDQLRLQNQREREKLETAQSFQSGHDYFQKLIVNKGQSMN